jgi:hypothetical protein
MTKKSYARQQRDLEKKKLQNFQQSVKGNKCWDELEDIYQNTCQLLSSHMELARVSSDQALLSEVTDKTTFVANITQLTNDLSTLSSELKAVHDMHADLRGGSNKPADFIRAAEIFEHYHLLMEKHQAVVLPTALYLTEQLDEASRKLAEKTAVAEAKGEDAIDVEVMEPVEKDLASQAAGADIVDVQQ